jgi:hypothetical protein
MVWRREMPTKDNTPNALESTEARIDDQDAALEESDERREENEVVEEADANLKGAPSIQEYDLYINPQKPKLGLYVRSGTGLPNLADSKQWVFDIVVAEDELSATLLQSIKADGYAFQELD